MILLPLLFFSFHLHARASSTPSPAYENRKYNIIIIAVDTLRADHLGCYGYFRSTSPNIDSLAQGGVLFNQAISQATWTLPSFASLFTSRYPQEHGVVSDEKKLGQNELTLAKILRKAGYQTAAFTAGGYFSNDFQLLQGFDTSVVDLNSSRNNSRALDWIESHHKEPFFLFWHNLDVHGPYESPLRHQFDLAYDGIVDHLALDYFFQMVYDHEWLPGIGPTPTEAYQRLVDEIRGNPRDLAHIVSHYDGAISYTDHLIGLLLRGIKKYGLDDNTIIVLLSDHGEDLGERSRIGHVFSAYDRIVRVPLIIRVPHWNQSPGRINAQVRLIDVAPTLLDVLAMPIPEKFHGASLAPWLRGESGKPVEFAFSLGDVYVSSNTAPHRQTLFSVRSTRWKLIRDTDHESTLLFDLAKDSAEIQDVASLHPDIIKDLLAKLDGWKASVDKKYVMSAESASRLSPKTEKMLRESGYLK